MHLPFSDTQQPICFSCWGVVKHSFIHSFIHSNQFYALQLFITGVITPNQIPLTTIVTYLQESYRSRISNHWATIPACSVVPPFTNNPRKYTVTYHFSDLQEFHTKCQLQNIHPPHISTSGKCHCVIIHQTTKATEYVGQMSKYLHKSPLSHI